MRTAGAHDHAVGSVVAAAGPAAPSTVERMMVLNLKPRLTVAELAEFSGDSVPTIYRWIKSGALRTVRHSTRKLIARTEYDRFLAERSEAA